LVPGLLPNNAFDHGGESRFDSCFFFGRVGIASPQVVNPRAALLSNFEVLALLRELESEHIQRTKTALRIKKEEDSAGPSTAAPEDLCENLRTVEVEVRCPVLRTEFNQSTCAIGYPIPLSGLPALTVSNPNGHLPARQRSRTLRPHQSRETSSRQPRTNRTGRALCRCVWCSTPVSSQSSLFTRS
jgi:hypothetical protein